MSSRNIQNTKTLVQQPTIEDRISFCGPIIAPVSGHESVVTKGNTFGASGKNHSIQQPSQLPFQNQVSNTEIFDGVQRFSQTTRASSQNQNPDAEQFNFSEGMNSQQSHSSIVIPFGASNMKQISSQHIPVQAPTPASTQ